MSAGTYSCTITDVNFCDATINLIITEPIEIAITLTPTDLTTSGANDGIVTSMVSGGIPPYIYDWTGSNGYTNAGGPININGLESGIYTLNITDSANCQQSMIAVVNDPGCAIVIAVTASVQPVCNGQPGDWQWINSGGVAPYINTITNSLGVSTTLANGASGSATLSPGIYSLTVTDAAGCSQQINITVVNPPAISISTISTSDLCF